MPRALSAMRGLALGAVVIGCGAGGPSPVPDPLPPPMVERADHCVWQDAVRDTHRGPSPVAEERVGPCERRHDTYRWRGCVHLDLSRVGCMNGCSECLAHVAGEDFAHPNAYRMDQCWPEPEPGCAGPAAGCSIAFLVGDAHPSSGGHRFPAPTYDCELIDGVCTEVAWPHNPTEEGPAEGGPPNPPRCDDG